MRLTACTRVCAYPVHNVLCASPHNQAGMAALSERLAEAQAELTRSFAKLAGQYPCAPAATPPPSPTPNAILSTMSFALQVYTRPPIE